MSDMSSSVSPSVLPTHDVKGHGPRHTAVQVLLMKTLRHAGSTWNQAEPGIVLGCFQQKTCLPTVGVLALSGGSP